MDTIWNLPDTVSNLDAAAFLLWFCAFIVFALVGFWPSRR